MQEGEEGRGGKRGALGQGRGSLREGVQYYGSMRRQCGVRQTCGNLGGGEREGEAGGEGREGEGRESMKQDA